MQNTSSNDVNFVTLPNSSMMKPLSGLPLTGSVSLSTLTDYVVHKTYHDITVMADLLPSKTDVERKIAVSQFSASTHRLFLRLLCLVKWASSVGKVSKCSDISYFLDQQAVLFVETADKLHALANQVVVQARLPNFSIPSAVDVLTTGSFPRLPSCIRDRIISPDPIQPKEKKATLKRIEQIILYRLAVEVIPPQIMQLTVEDGIVTLLVPNEFKTYLTLMGDGHEVPWRLLKLEILVEDLDIGGGKPLVHNSQINYVHELVQSRLLACVEPLCDLYNVLHTFCLSLQLEVLQAQATRLLNMSWGKFIHIDEYLPGQRMTISYWRINPYVVRKSPMLITICLSLSDPSRPLQVLHTPNLTLDDANLSSSCSHVKHLCLEKLIQKSACVRSFSILTGIKKMLRKHFKKDLAHFSVEAIGRHCILFVPLLETSKLSHCLRITVDPQTGVVIPLVEGVDDKILEKMENEINVTPILLIKWTAVLRDCLISQLYKQSLQLLRISCTTIFPPGESNKNQLLVKIPQFPSFQVGVEMVSDRFACISCHYSILAEQCGTTTALYLKKTYAEFQSKARYAWQQKSLNSCMGEDELIQAVSICETHVPFVLLLESLSKVGVEVQGLQDEDGDLGFGCKIFSLPEVPGVGPEIDTLLQDCLLLCSFQFQAQSSKSWTVELIMKNILAGSQFASLLKQRNSTIHVHLTYKITPFSVCGDSNYDVVNSFLDDWNNIGRLFGSVYYYLEQLKHPECYLGKLTQIQSYDFNSITIMYGKALGFFVTISCTKEKKFFLSFGRVGGGISSNAHAYTKHFLTEMFNANPDISKLVHVLIDTCAPLQSLSRLPPFPALGIGSRLSTADNLQQVFAVVPHTVSQFRVCFQGLYFIEIHCVGNGKICVRDSSVSQFNYAKVKSPLAPIPGLATFLLSYKNKSHQKEGPLSPVLPLCDTMSMSSTNFVSLFSHSLDVLCTSPGKIVQGQFLPCILEHFLCTSNVFRHVDKYVSSSEGLSKASISQSTGDTVKSSATCSFIAKTLHFLCRRHPQQLHKLLLKVQPVSNTGVHALENWNAEDLQVLEKYFELRVISSPSRLNAIRSFFNIITAPSAVLKDLIQLMRLELTRGRSVGVIPNWFINLCLTSSPRGSISVHGMSCVLIKDKILIFVQFTQNLQQSFSSAISAPTIVVPLLHDPAKTMVSVLPNTLSGNSSSSQQLKHIDTLLTAFDDMRQKSPGEITFFVAVRYLTENLTLSS
ncbi:mediator of RNA polymerase II transcription subunit 14-like [Clavelina lepadiformis]|uniref:Mediator of RNA polymerase II transcription subunit 14 n=2 Tax=Clavelina lepadiformis TaxID=159417 RepID=A0ABP0GXD0_CLALP